MQNETVSQAVPRLIRMPVTGHRDEVDAPSSVHAVIEGDVSTRVLVTTIATLVEAIDGGLSSNDTTRKERAREARAMLLCCAHAAKRSLANVLAGGERRPIVRGGLAPWQVHLLRMHIRANLGGSVRCDDLANMVRLSSSYFNQAFKQSFGRTPHAFLMKSRMQRAQELMLTTDATLGQIALDCGFSDQPHLSRLFQEFTGETPGAWRRARKNASG